MECFSKPQLRRHGSIFVIASTLAIFPKGKVTWDSSANMNIGIQQTEAAVYCYLQDFFF